MGEHGQSWPELRENLSLNPAPAAADGSRCWTLHDPLRDSFFNIGYRVFEILSYWPAAQEGEDRGGSPADRIAEAVNRETTIKVTPQEVQEVAEFLVKNSLAQSRSHKDSEWLLTQRQRAQKGRLSWLASHYLFFKIPLFRPDRFLRTTYPYVAWLYSAFSWKLMVVLAALGGYLSLRQMDRFWTTAGNLFSLSSILWFAVAISVAKIVHELGHAYTAYRYGCRVSTMGVAFIVLWPVLYTDVNAAWKLSSRRARLHISAAGMIAEIGVAILATLLWNFAPEGPVQSALFLIATTTWVGTLLINIMPFLRFDGYFFLCDWIKIDNLFARAFAMGRWQLREWLFGLQAEPPEICLPMRQRFLVLFAVTVWLYRFFLFLGIALLVYHMFFKVLGIILMCFEIWVFIAKPILSEFRWWWENRRCFGYNFRMLRTLLLGLAVLSALLLPWRSSVDLPAVLSVAREYRLFVPADARIETVSVQTGASVQAGQTLIVLNSPELEADIDRERQRADILGWEMANAGNEHGMSVRGRVAEEEWHTSQARLTGLMEQQAQLSIRAPITGEVTAMLDDLQPDQWLGEGEWLITVSDSSRLQLQGYITESDLGKIAEQADAHFYPDNPELPVVPARVTTIERGAVAELDKPELSDLHGGTIITRLGDSGQLIPDEPRYKVLLTLYAGEEHELPDILFRQTARGRVRIQGDHYSLLARIFRQVVAVWNREVGF